MAAVKKVNSFLTTESENYEGSMGNYVVKLTQSKSSLFKTNKYEEEANVY